MQVGGLLMRRKQPSLHIVDYIKPTRASISKVIRAPPTASIYLNTAILENTLDSMAAAFELGADVVELDIHPTTDGQFAVFHDWTIDCRTNGKGVTRKQSMALSEDP